jgi:hypothetical protein
MHRRASTALAIALTFLLSPVTALACEWQCARDASAKLVASAESPDSTDSCHGLDKTTDDGAASLSSSPRDCGAHHITRTTPALLGFNRAGDYAAPGAVPQPRAAEHRAPIEAGPPMARDLAPPGPSVGLMIPLRI